MRITTRAKTALRADRGRCRLTCRDRRPAGEPLTRSYRDGASPKGLKTDNLPWRLWDKGKRLHWDPADLDFEQDRKDWEAMPIEHQMMVAGLARGFMVGEEGVTLDIMPLVFAMADEEGRAEEPMFLTQFG